jgi:hypothetical protein
LTRQWIALGSAVLRARPTPTADPHESEAQMARDLHTHPPAAHWPICGTIPVLAAAFLGPGDIQAPMRLGSCLHVVSVASASPLSQEPVNLASAPVMPANEKQVTGNPLWAIPIGAWSETVARPIVGFVS